MTRLVLKPCYFLKHDDRQLHGSILSWYESGHFSFSNPRYLRTHYRICELMVVSRAGRPECFMNRVEYHIVADPVLSQPRT
jgi:hypothetical protein